MIHLYGYWRSSAAYRVRIALNLKGVPHEHHSVHLVKDGGEQHKSHYREMNPQQLVPLLVDGDFTINQSVAILEYLDEAYPEPKLLPSDIRLKAKVRAVSQSIACDIHPLNNLRVLQYIAGPLEQGDARKTAWYRHWVDEGFKALEKELAAYGANGPFCFGEQVSMADICLLTQIYNAYRFNCPMEAFPRLEDVYKYCMESEAFNKAAPEAQDDAV